MQRHPEWPSSVPHEAPVLGSQSLTVLSSDAEARSWSSGENATALTQPKWPSSVPHEALVLGSQSLTVLSSDAEARSWPSGKNATVLTEPEWPSSTCKEGFQSSWTIDILVTLVTL